MTFNCGCRGLVLDLKPIADHPDNMQWAIVENNRSHVTMFESTRPDCWTFDLNSEVIVWLDNSLEWGEWMFDDREAKIFFSDYSHAILFKIAWENRCDGLLPF